MREKERIAYIVRNASKVSCLQHFTNLTVLGQGSVGTVMLACRKASQCFAAKLSLVDDDESQMRFEREIEMQKAFYPKAPDIISHCIDVFEKHKIGVIIMELIDRTLDVVLSTKQANRALFRVVADVDDLLRFARSRELVHGDLAFFNMAYVERKEGKELIFIDFDESSNLYERFPVLDAIRLLLELHPSTRSQNTKPITKNNEAFLQKEALLRWRPQVPLEWEKIDTKKLDEIWTAMFCAYCVAARVPCLSQTMCDNALRSMKIEAVELKKSKRQKLLATVIPRLETRKRKPFVREMKRRGMVLRSGKNLS
jgi:hypothetical protein